MPLAELFCMVSRLTHNGCMHAGSASKYDLIANAVHEGLPDHGTYRAQVHRQGEDTWHDVQDLRVTDVLPQMVALSETYLQLYELRSDKPPGASKPLAQVK